MATSGGCGSGCLKWTACLFGLLIIVGFVASRSQQVARKEVQLAEQKRSAALTPEQREAEEKAKREDAVKRKAEAEAEAERREDAKKPKTYKERDTVHVGYTTYAVWRSWWSNRLSSNELLNQRPNATYLFVELTVRNNDKKARMVPPFHLVDEGGAEYQASAAGWAVEGSIGIIQTLNPDVGKQGFVVFDVPYGRTYRLKLSGGFWSLQDAFVDITPTGSRAESQRVAEAKQDAEAQAEKKREAEARAQAKKERQEADDAAKWRTWTDSSGSHKIEAKFGGLGFDKVTLVKRDGSKIQLPLERLSEEDQQWIKKRR